MEKQSLYIYKLDDQGNSVKFPNDTIPAKLGEYTYTAQRMSGTPTLTATLNYPSCLDDLWTGEEFIEFRGERYYAGQVPTSSKDNKSIMYKHELQFVSERIVLENVYFLDVVTAGADTYHSNSTTVKFMGDINEFVGRLNASMIKSGIGYSVVIDEDITSEIKLVSLDNVYLAEALQSIYTIYDLPYYFVGKVCHIGYTENVISTPFEYRKGLISIKKTNANYKIVNRVTGVGSSDNIPFYYPNDSQDGDIEYNTNGFDKSAIRSIDYNVLKSKIPNFLAKTLTWENNPSSEAWETRTRLIYFADGVTATSFDTICHISGIKNDTFSLYPKLTVGDGDYERTTSIVYFEGQKIGLVSNKCDITIGETGKSYTLKIEWTVFINRNDTVGQLERSISDDSVIEGLESRVGWSYTDGGNQKFLKDKESGIYLSDMSAVSDGDTLTFLKIGYIEPSSALMPSIYRETGGAERFYNALNDTYKIPGTNDYYTFKNLYSKQKVKEIKVDFSDIKPTIEGVTNVSGQLFGEIADVAFDQNDSDELGTGSVNNVFNGTDEYVHSYFYIKLHIYNGNYGFNLFEQGLEGGTAVINMTTGNCAACEFEIGVTYNDIEPYRAFNPVLVDDSGNLPAGDFKQKVTSSTANYVERQQDTSKNEVWIAVKKDNTSFGVVMPNATNNYRPAIGDKFVITGIKMPKHLVVAAEDRLDEALIKYMSENNDEKFSFSLSFSRVFLADNPELAGILNENARIYIKYNGREYLMYVNSFTCKADKNCLYDISVELTDKLSANVSALRSTITEIAGDIIGDKIGAGPGSIGDILAKTSNHYIRKDQPDFARYIIRFLRGMQTGSYSHDSSGGMINEEGDAELNNLLLRSGLVSKGDLESDNFVLGALGAGFGLLKKDSTGKSYLEVDKLYARVKATFSELEIRKLTYSGGNYVFSPAGMTCIRVEDIVSAYRLYFNANDGEKVVENLFNVDDLVQCRESNVKSGLDGYTGNRYYWRRCIAIGADYIDLSKTDCDPDSDIPQVGDSVVTIGNKSDLTRQNAIIISVYGEGSPSFIQYKGINDFTLDGKAKTIISPQLNKFTGKFIFTSGTDAEIAIGNVDKKADNAQSSANEADRKAQAAQESAEQAQEAAEMANAEIADMSSDSVISPVEKPALKEKWDVILSEKTKIDAQAINTGVSPDAYDNAYNALYNLIGNNLNDLTTKWEIDGSVLRSAFKNYYDARTDLLNTIARVTKEKADKAEADAGNARERADDAYKLSEEVNDSVDIILTSIIPDMQEQIDGNIMSWDGEQVPTLANYPANEWTTGEEKDRHIGDTYDYYLTQDGVKVVKRYKFRKSGENYEWTPLADSDAARLEVELRATLGIANSKNSISYGSRPVPPYSIDDIWITTLKSIYVCRVQRAEGSSGLETDWELVNDTQLRLSNMASDGIISREEKPSYRNTLDQIKKEYATYNASETSVSKTALTSAYNNIVSYMTATLKVTENSDTDITESQRNQFNVYLAAWYSSVTEFTNLIAKEEAGKAVDGIQVGGTNLLNGTTLDWVDAENAAPNYYVDSVYLPQLRGKQITFSGFIKGIDAQAGSIGLEINIAYTDGTHGYSQMFFNDRGNFEIHVQKHTLILDKEISNIKAYPIFRTGTVSGTIKVKQIQVEIGNKATDWKPSIHDQDEYAKQQGQQAVDNLQVGSQNLISKKMMLKWNEKNKDIATWGQDDDGIYLNVYPHLLFDNFSISNTIQNPIFNINFKENTQYVFSIEWKTDTTEEIDKIGLFLRLWYTDGSVSMISLSNKTLKKTRVDIITPAGKTVEKISSSYGYAIRARIYNISLIEGNKPLNGFPVAEEDQTGANNVNLAEGTKEFTLTASSTDNSTNKHLYVSKIKPNTVYYVNAGNIENLVGSPDKYSFVLYDMSVKNMLSSRKLYDKKGGILITRNDFTEQAGRLLCYAGPYGSTAGNSVKFTELMLVEGFQPAQVWTPSFSEQQNAIDEAQSQIKEISSTVTKLEATDESIIASVNTVIENVGNNAITAERYTFGQSWNSGKMLYTDPTFKAGVNNVKVYNNLGNGNVLITRVQKQSDSPTDSDYNLEIKNQGEANPYLGGFTFLNASRANVIFIYRIIAKIPVGYKISFARNRAGDYLTEYFATSREGTGKWEEYIYVIRCGTKGVFESIGYFYIVGELGTPDNPVLWYLAYASVFDMSAGISTADQAKQFQKYVLDLTPDIYDRNIYYPVTMKIPGVPATTIKVYIDYYNSGDPEWSTRNDNHTSANFIWTSNGSDATNFNVLRDILNVDYRFAAVTPIGNIGQMEKSSNEFVYIRGGAIYNFEIEHGVVPVLHTSPFTVLGQTINLLVAVSAPVRTDVTKTEYDSKMVQLDDQIRQTVTKTEFSASNEELKKQIGNVVTKYDQISGKVETVDNRLGTIEKSGYIVKDKFVDIFSSFKNQLGESIISSISLSPGTARIAADKIEISGATIFKDDGGNIVNIFGTGGDVFSINNGVFKVDKNGKLTATNAVIKGTIEATSGKIGGFTIGAINLKNGELELSQDKIVYNDSNITASFGLNVYATGGSNVTSSLYIKNKYSGQQRACAVFEGTVSSNYIAIGRAIYTGIEVMLDVHGQSQLQGNCYFGVDKSNKAYFYGQIYCKDLSDSYMYNLPRYNNILGPSQPNDFGTLGISKSTGRIALIG